MKSENLYLCEPSEQPQSTKQQQQLSHNLHQLNTTSLLSLYSTHTRLFQPLNVPRAAILSSVRACQGKPKPSEEDTTIYKRNLQSTYQLKMQVSRAILSTIDKQHRHFPFTLRSLDESKAKFAIKECRQHDLVHAYPVLREKEGEVVGQCKWTVMVSERGAVRLCGVAVEKERVTSEKKVQDEEVKKLLNQPLLLPAGATAASGAAGGSTPAVSAEEEAAAAKKKAAAAAKKKKQAAKKKAAAAAGGEAGKDGDKEEDDEGGDETS
jgi:hypothetical protein